TRAALAGHRGSFMWLPLPHGRPIHLILRRHAMDEIPLLIDLAPPSSIFREQNRISTLRTIGNGLPGTFVLFPDRFRVSLPTDQILFAGDSGGYARVGFGGMQFGGVE